MPCMTFAAKDFIQHCMEYKLKQIITWGSDSTCSVSNGSKFPGRLRVRFHPNPDCGEGFYHTINPDLWNWAGFSSKTRHFNLTIWAPIQYFSSDCIMTWSIRRLLSFSPSYTSQFQICNWTNIRWVPIENPRISLKIWCYSTAIQRILVGLQIWKRDMNEGLKLHNLHIHHVMIRSELKYLIGAKVEAKS